MRDIQVIFGMQSDLLNILMAIVKYLVNNLG